MKQRRFARPPLGGSLIGLAVKRCSAAAPSAALLIFGNVRPPVYLHFVDVNQIARSPQAVPRDAVSTRVALQAHAAPVHRLNMHRPVCLNRFRADAGRQLKGRLRCVVVASRVAVPPLLAWLLHRRARSTNAGTCSRRDDVGGNIYGSRDRLCAAPQHKSTTTHAWLCSPKRFRPTGESPMQQRTRYGTTTYSSEVCKDRTLTHDGRTALQFGLRDTGVLG